MRGLNTSTAWVTRERFEALEIKFALSRLATLFVIRAGWSVDSLYSSIRYISVELRFIRILKIVTQNYIFNERCLEGYKKQYSIKNILCSKIVLPF